jgi:perosamine synthetase
MPTRVSSRVRVLTNLSMTRQRLGFVSPRKDPQQSDGLIPVSEPLIGDNVLPLVRECIETGWVSSDGAFVKEFEGKWSSYCGVEHGIAVSNGTAALQIAVAALGLKPGSEIIMPSFTIISCAIAILEAGCVPVLVDCDPASWCMDLDEVEFKISPRTRAVMPVHMLGHPVDMRGLTALATKHDLFVIEDAAESHGAEVAGRRVGGLGDMGCFSFYANKIITTGEGGMVVTNNGDFVDRLRSLRNLCFRPGHRFSHTEIGHNYRLTNLQAAVGVAQIARVEAHIQKKRWIAACYNDRLKNLPASRPVERDWARNVYWMYGLVLDDGVQFDATEFANRLRKRGVDTRPFFVGMHEQPVLRRKGLFKGEAYPVSEKLARRGLYLPSGLTLTESQIEFVSDAIIHILL